MGLADEIEYHDVLLRGHRALRTKLKADLVTCLLCSVIGDGDRRKGSSAALDFVSLVVIGIVVEACMNTVELCLGGIAFFLRCGLLLDSLK